MSSGTRLTRETQTFFVLEARNSPNRKSMSLLNRIEQVPQARVVHQSVANTQTQIIDRLVNFPFVTQRQLPTIQTILQTVEMPQVQFKDMVNEPVMIYLPRTLTGSWLCQLCCNTIQTCRIPRRSHRSSTLRRSSMYQPSSQHRRWCRFLRVSLLIEL